MTDFTKDELKSILDLFQIMEDNHVYCHIWRNSHGWDNILWEKIQSMIDNYCEHEPCGHEICCVTCNKIIGVL